MKTLALTLLLPLSTHGAASVGPGVRSLDPPSATSLTTGGLFWTLPVGNFIPQIALGDRGGQVLGFVYPSGLALDSSFDASPPAPIWTLPYSTSSNGIRAASESDVYLFSRVRVAASGFTSMGILEKLRSRSGLPAWRFDFPAQIFSYPSFDLSRDGQAIVSVFLRETPYQTELRVHDPATGEPLETVALPPAFDTSRFDLSPDGTVAAFSDSDATGATRIYDFVDRALFSVPGSIAGDQALSDRGLVLATYDRSSPADLRVRAFVRGPGGYQPVIDVSSAASVYPLELAVSDDGTTLAVGWWDSGQPTRGIVRAYDVATAAMTMEHVDTGTSGQILPDSIRISADGSRFVVGQFGTDAGSFPELSVYSRTSSTPLREHARGGEVLEVALSPDGKRYAAARAAEGHPGIPYAVELYEFGEEDLVVRGRPSVGATITFELHGAPGTRAALLRAFALAPTPIDLPGVGTLHLDPATLSSTPIGVVPPSGVAAHSLVVGAEPGMIGRTLFFQGLTMGPRTLTNDFVQLTIVP